MLKFLCLTVLIVVATGSLAARSAARLQKEAAAKAEDLVTIKGCVLGSHFKPSRDAALDLPAKLAKSDRVVARREPRIAEAASGSGFGTITMVTTRS
jgi:hypothetical protein